MRRTSYGALGGVGGTLALSGLRQALAWVGLVQETAPQQVVERLEELGLVDDWSPAARRLLTVAAHPAYGMGMGVAFGLLRREQGAHRRDRSRLSPRHPVVGGRMG